MTDKTKSNFISHAEMADVTIVGEYYMTMDKEKLVTLLIGSMTTEQLASKALKLKNP